MRAICVKCWVPEAVVKFHLDNSWVFECEECGETFTCEEVEAAVEAVNKWNKILKWVDQYPQEEEEAAE